MEYKEFVEYIRNAHDDEEYVLENIAERMKLDEWQKFRMIYYYSVTYNIPSSVMLLLNPKTDKKDIKFRTDRRFVRIGDRFERLMSELTQHKLLELKACKSTSEAYNVVSKWYYFGRYAAFLLLEVYCDMMKPDWVDDIRFGWEPKETYTKGAENLCGTKDRKAMDELLEHLKKDTGEWSFAIESYLCVAAKVDKGSRYNGFYIDRMFREADAAPTPIRNLIYQCAYKQ